MMYLKRGLKEVRIRVDLEFSAIQLLANKLPTRPVMILAAQGEHVGPIEQMSGRGVSVQDLEIPFGSYVQVTNATMPHNSLEPRTRGAIALGIMGNATGGRVFMALDTGKLIRRSHAKVIPMTAEIISQVNHLGRDKTSLLTFQNRRGEDIGERTVN